MADDNYYSDIDEVRALYMDDVSETSIDDSILVRGALVVHNLINATLGKLYTVPFPLSSATPDTPPQIRDISDTLTACWASAHTAGLGTVGSGPSQAQCKQAREDLKDLAEGKTTIPGYSTNILPSSNTEGEHTIFGKVDTLAMGQDPDQRDRIADERD